MRFVTVVIMSGSLLAATSAGAVTSKTPGGCPAGTTPIQQSGGTYSGGPSGVSVWYYCKPPEAKAGGAGPCARGASKAPPGGYKKQVASKPQNGC